jgi:hypothetical protein
MAHWHDPSEIVTLTIKLPRVLRARIKATATIVEATPSELLRPFLESRFHSEAMEELQREWIEGWKAQQDASELERLYGKEVC